MKGFAIAVVLVLLAGSTALGQVGYVTMMPMAPAPVVAYYPAAPIVSPWMAPVLAPVVRVPARYVVASPVVVSAPVMDTGCGCAVPTTVYSPPVAYAAPMPVVAPMYASPYIVHPKVYVAGQPVRNVLRAVTP